MIELSMETMLSKTVEIKNIKDTTKFIKRSIDEIYKFGQGDILL